MSKINILCIPSDNHGVGHFRFIDPHVQIQKSFSDEFNIEMNPKVNFDDITYLEQFNIIFGHKDMIDFEKAETLYPLLKAKGIKLVLDIDDSWNLPKSHGFYNYAKESKYTEKILQILPLYDYVTTTTQFFANQIKKYNKNVIIFVNGVDPDSKKYKINSIESTKTRVGWLGGSMHIEDLSLLKPMFRSINQRYKNLIQTVLVGFDTRGVQRYIDENGRQQERPFKPKEVVWFDYEKIFTSDYTNVSPEYKTWLMKFKNDDDTFPNLENEVYRRLWTKPFASYATNYNNIDIALAPLVDNHFNLCKSELKAIEAGFYKKPIICSDLAPYQGIIKHGVNGFLVKNNSQQKDFIYYIKQLIDNPELAKQMGENLYETVKDKYNLKNISKDRADFYKQILK